MFFLVATEKDKVLVVSGSLIYFTTVNILRFLVFSLSKNKKLRVSSLLSF